MIRPTKEGYHLMHMMVQPVRGKRKWSITDDKRLLIPHDCTIGLVKGSEFPPRYSAEAVVWIETVPGFFETKQPFGSWKIKSVEVLKGLDAQAMPSPGMQQMPLERPPPLPAPK